MVKMFKRFLEKKAKEKAEHDERSDHLFTHPFVPGTDDMPPRTGRIDGSRLSWGRIDSEGIERCFGATRKKYYPKSKSEGSNGCQ